MQDLMLVLSSVMTFEQIVEKLEQDIAAYKADPNEKTKSGISFYCAMILSKEAVESKGLDQMSKELSEMERIKERLNTKDN